MTTYHITRSIAVTRSTQMKSPYFLILDDGLDREAMLAGVVKNTYEDLIETIDEIARLTSLVVPSQEAHARELLEALIVAKRSYAKSEQMQ